MQPTDLQCRESIDVVGHVKWDGPGQLNLPPHNTCYTACKVTPYQPLDNSILLVESPVISKFPASVLVPLLVMSSSSMDVNNFTTA